MSNSTLQTFEYLPVDNSDVEQSRFFAVQDDGTLIYQFMLPQAMGNNLYTNNYLLQTVPAVYREQLEQTAMNPVLKDGSYLDEQIVNLSNKQLKNFTEITLSDDQYCMLEQNGWLLLETGVKVFVLDNLGLHDITDNDKLIDKLKNEVQIKKISSNLGCTRNNGLVQKLTKEQTKTNNAVIQNNEIQRETSSMIDGSEVKLKQEEDIFQEFSNVTESIKDKVIRLKTDFSLKEIPDKVVLGKTISGKKLIAKFIKTDNKNIKNTFDDSNTLQKKVSTAISNATHIEKVTELQDSVKNEELQFEDFIRLSLDNKQCNPADSEEAEAVVKQLLQLPKLKDTILENNLFITKVIRDEDKNGKIAIESLSFVVCGRVSAQDNNTSIFNYEADMMQRLISNYDENSKEVDQPKTVLHMHIMETKSSNMKTRNSITVTKRYIPKQMYVIKKQSPSTVYACGACASVFQIEKELQEHQIQCMETDNILTIDTDTSKTDSTYGILKHGKEKTYSCMHCELKFSRLGNCQRHLKMHMYPTRYKCKMCPNSFYHPASLSKHIVAKHIKV